MRYNFKFIQWIEQLLMMIIVLVLPKQMNLHAIIQFSEGSPTAEYVKTLVTELIALRTVHIK